VNDYITSLIRTATPFLVGLLGSAAARVGFDMTDETTQALVVFGLGTAWYAAARALERRWPNFGWLLGNPKQPVYGSFLT